MEGESEGERFARHLGEAMDEAWRLATEAVPIVAAKARVWAEVGQPDAMTDEDVTLRIGDVWMLLDELERLGAAADAAFYAMCDQRDSPDEEVFQDAIDALGYALRHER
jgi:FAD/FMN-containing dehydrogenase